MTNVTLNYKTSYFLCAFLFLFSAKVNAQNSQQLYNQVQNIYTGYTSTSANDCNKVKSLISSIQQYTGYRSLVPTSRAYSVNYPRKVNNPTIGDLARDRIARLRNQFKSCFEASVNPRALNLYNQVQNIYTGYTSTSANDCNRVKSLIASIQQYTGYGERVPASKAYSVNYPRKVNNPTIGDLARDRIARLKNQFKSCFEARANPRALNLYNQVQNIYTGYTSTSANDCNRVKSLIASIQQYTGYGERVPASKAYSVNYPRKVNNPTIGDLARDRIARLKNQFKSCFEGQVMSNYINRNLSGVWKYVHDGREFHFAIEREGNKVNGSFRKHGYSYPPIYTGAEMISNNGVRFKFKLGGTYQVSLQFFHNQLGVSAYLSESWNNNGVLKNLNTLQPLTVQKPRPVVKITPADVTFLNQTRSSVIVYWINNGKEIKYRTLSPGQSYVQGTFSSHKWRVRINGRVYLNYTITREKVQLVRIR